MQHGDCRNRGHSGRRGGGRLHVRRLDSSGRERERLFRLLRWVLGATGAVIRLICGGEALQASDMGANNNLFPISAHSLLWLRWWKTLKGRDSCLTSGEATASGRTEDKVWTCFSQHHFLWGLFPLDELKTERRAQQQLHSRVWWSCCGENNFPVSSLDVWVHVWFYLFWRVSGTPERFSVCSDNLFQQTSTPLSARNPSGTRCGEREIGVPEITCQANCLHISSTRFSSLGLPGILFFFLQQNSWVRPNETQRGRTIMTALLICIVYSVNYKFSYWQTWMQILICLWLLDDFLTNKFNQ